MASEGNRKELLKESRQNPVVISQKFRNIYKKHKEENILDNYLYCFYEGRDDSKYYNLRVENISNFNISHLEADGKDKLLELYHIINMKKFYIKNKLLFFIDKDFDDLIKIDKLIELQRIENLYITPVYSIENFYTTFQSFQKILKSEFYILESDEKFEKLSTLFLLRQKDFHEIILDVNAWIAVQNYFLHNQEKRNIPYNELTLDNILSISLEQIKPKHRDIINFLETKFHDSFKINDPDVENKFQELKDTLFKCDKQAHFRGKFEIEFLTKFLRLLVERSNQKDGLGLKFIDINEKIKVKLNLNDTVSNLTQYADTPQCLKIFIELFKETKSTK